MKPPAPLCLVFQPCDRVVEREGEGTSIDHIVRRLIARSYPATHKLGFYACCTSAHGVYEFEIQLQLPDGDVVWKEKPPIQCKMLDPLVEYDIQFHLYVQVPAAGAYAFVLLANGEPIARRKFKADLNPQLAPRK